MFHSCSIHLFRCYRSECAYAAPFVDLFASSFWYYEIQLGQITTTPLGLLLGGILMACSLYAQQILRRVLQERVFPRFKLEAGVAVAYATISCYLFLILCLLIVLPITFGGISWQTIGVMMGAISFGIGFGLRNIADNFVSGVIVLFEQPIRVGDYVEVGGHRGTVEEIKARSTIVRTNDNVDIIVPNSSFISETVINWSHSDRRRRFRIPVGVHYKSDVFLVKRVLEDCARHIPLVLSEPLAVAKLIQFGESSIDFELWVWTIEGTSRPEAFLGEANYHIWRALKENGIEIPYPQRDVYLHRLSSEQAEP